MLLIQDFRRLHQDSGNRVRIHAVVDQQHPLLFPAGKRDDLILVREACQHALLRFRGGHIGHDHHLEMGIGKIDPQLGHRPGILGLAVHQAVEPGIPQRSLVFLQELCLLRPDFTHVLQRCFNAGKMLNGRSHQASAAFFILGDVDMADQLPHRPGIVGNLHPQNRDHSGAQQYEADHRHQGEGVVVIPQPPGIRAGQHINEAAGSAGAFRKQGLPAVLHVPGMVPVLRVGQGNADQ